jgi:hypothetical protein
MIKNTVAIAILIIFVLFILKALNESSVFTALIALGALAISLVNIYYQYFNSTHQLSCTLIASSYDGNKLDIYCSFENTGSYEEIVLGSTFIFPSDNGDGFSTISSKGTDDFLPEIMEPFILKSKEITLKHYTWNITSDRLREHFRIDRKGILKQDINLKIDFIDPEKRNKSAVIIKLVEIHLTKELERIRTSYHHQNKLFEEKRIKI